MRGYYFTVGTRFGRLTVLGVAPRNPKTNGARSWLCRCDCGKESAPTGRSLASGDATSCGCYRDQRAIETSTTHGLSGTREHRAWLDMKRRCNNPKRSDYRWYGGRGITVCAEWEHSFENFLSALGPCPAGLTLDRIESSIGYQPGNCRWATPQQQANNRRTNRLLTLGNETHTMAEWSRRTGLTMPTIQLRVGRRGWSVERALTTPPLKAKNTLR